MVLCLSSVLVRRASSVVRRQQLHKHLLLRNYLAESYETSPEASLGGGETNDTERNFDSIIILVSMATERKKLKKDLKIFSSNLTNDRILKKLHKKHQWDKGNKRYETEF